MNNTIYTLTLLSAIFLPLNLIVGFFGMNTTSLPFTVGDGGTYSVITLLITTAILSSVLTIIIKR
jgi:magnesium transporter